MKGEIIMNKKNIIWGLIFIVAAILVVCGAFGFLGNPVNVIITVLLIPIIISNAVHLIYPGIFFPLAVIAILYDDYLGIQALTPWPVLFIALFLSIGLSFLFPKYRHFYKHSEEEEEGFHEIINEADDSVINLSAKFGGSVKYVNTNQLQEVNIDCAFSGMKVYFDHADIAGEKASVNVRLSFSGLELCVPKNWKVVDNLACTLGGVDQKGAASETTGKTLLLKGSVSFSGIKIIYI